VICGRWLSLEDPYHIPLFEVWKIKIKIVYYKIKKKCQHLKIYLKQFSEGQTQWDHAQISC